MKLRNLTALIIVVFTVLLTGNCFTQQDTSTQKPTRLILKDGSELMGIIEAEDSLTVYFKMLGNVSMTIQKNQIKKIEHLTGEMIGGEYVRQDPNHTRLFFSPTARALRTGQGYFSAYQIFFPFFAVGVTDFLSLAGGLSLIPGATSQIIYFAPKITPFENKKFSVAGGLLYLNSTKTSEKGLGIYYGVATYGTSNTSITAGLGWGFYGSDVADKPIVLIGGELRATKSIKFITENWLIPNSEVNLLSFGIRFFGENLAADFGLIHPSGAEMKGFPFFPWLGFAYNFGVRK